MTSSVGANLRGLLLPSDFEESRYQAQEQKGTLTITLAQCAMKKRNQQLGESEGWLGKQLRQLTGLGGLIPVKEEKLSSKKMVDGNRRKAVSESSPDIAL